MKKTILLIAAVSFVIYFSSCRKCYHCHNDCMLCTRIDSIFIDSTRADSIHIDSILHCKDWYNSDVDYLKAISADTAARLKCVATKPTYQYDFCSTQPGQDKYPNYFDKGGRAECDPK